MKITPLLLIVFPLILAADPPAGYYANAEGKNGAELEAALHNIIDDHTIIAYSWPPYQDLDTAPGDPNSVELIYSGLARAKNRHGGSSGDWNREHIWPKSFGVGDDGADTSDVFNLRPSDVQVNAERGSLYFDDTDLAIPLSYSAPGSSKDADSWEPRAIVRGDIARSCFYMAVRYDGSDFATTDLTLSDSPLKSFSRFGRLETLLEWHTKDPVSQEERVRNQAVYERYQRNRNPFIDRPEFVRLFLRDYPAMDADADGISDLWEWTKVGDAAPGSNDDADKDGVPLLAEFAMLGDPAKSDVSVSPRLLKEGAGYVYEYRKNRSATAVSFVVQGSENLAEDSWTEVSGTEDVVVVGEDLEIVRVTIVIDGARYFRLKLSL
jgi:endonuclease I